MPNSDRSALVVGGGTMGAGIAQTLLRTGCSVVLAEDGQPAAAAAAIRMAEEGVATAEDIDKGMVLGYRFPIGPLRLTDLVGLDVRLAVADYLAGTLGDRFSPPQLLRDKVAAGELGKKSGMGFFSWT